MVTFPNGTTGQPRREGRFEGLDLQERCNAMTSVHKARQNAASARNIASRL